QGSANLEFWETYKLAEIYTALQSLDSRLAKGEGAVASDSAAVADTTKAVAAADSTKAAEKAVADKAAQQHPLFAKLAQIQ
ncbi:hypothetical protein RFZ51_07060, partial [Acinetobacter baumannii]|nr:hypothetical protein [Acinetobacter baumannii]